jgi:sporulation protein YlmC with PRC-barrel domain
MRAPGRSRPAYNGCMQAPASQMQSLPVISLQTGEAVALTESPLIDIGRLEIVAYRCESARNRSHLLLLARDIRQLATDCIIIDNEEELVEPGDIVRLHDLLESNYNPLDKTVVSDTGRKLGHVEDYTINLETSRVQKLHVRPSLFRAWMGSNLIIDRSQILDITPKVITVRDATVKAPALATEPLPETPS